MAKSHLRLSLLFLITFVSFCDIRSGDLLGFADVRSYSLGGSYASIPSVGNPAGYGFSRQRFVSFSYINRYGMKALSTFSGFINMPNKVVDISFYASRYGMDAYNENKFSLAVYRRLSRRVALGIRVCYLLNQQHEKSRNVHYLMADVGMLIKPIDKLTLGMLINNPLRKSVIKGKTNEKAPVLMSAGLSYQPLSTLFLTAEVEKSTDTKPLFKLGAEYNPIPELVLRGGVCGKPFVPTFGAGLRLRRFALDVGARYHNVLGMEFLCGLGVVF